MPYKPVATHDKLIKKIMADPEARAEYEAFQLHLELAEQLKQCRLKANMTQAQVADRMQTYKPTISRMESATSSTKHSPSLITLLKYAHAVDCELKIIFTPRHKKTPKHKSLTP